MAGLGVPVAGFGIGAKLRRRWRRMANHRLLSQNRAEALIRVRETLDRAALRKLPAAELAQIGVTVEKATDEVTIAAGRDDLDKVVAALLDDVTQAEAA